jgi:hypothetical protein
VGLSQPEATAASKYQSPYLRTGLMEVASSVGLLQPEATQQPLNISHLT